MNSFFVLTVINHGSEGGETSRVTVSPQNVNAVVSPEALVQVSGMALHRTFVSMMDGGAMELFLTGEDLDKLEKAVGCYLLPED